MAVLAEASDSPVATTEFRAALDALGIAQHRAAKLFGVGPRSIRRWRDGARRVPCGVSLVVRLMACGAVTTDQVEQAAVRTNGGASLGAPAPLLVSAPEQSAAAGAEAAALAGPDLSTAEKVCALAQTPAVGPAAILGALSFTSAAVQLPSGPIASGTTPWPTRRR
jgi:DNA-binding transcriptional regulator YdaS (Cro superfamily)